ncbi:unnamed protein product [Closterium sp. NIES-53]
MTTLRVLLHVAAQRDYELHSLDFSTTFLQGNLHEEIWLHRPPGFTESFPPGTQWSLRRPVYDLRQAPVSWRSTRSSSVLGCSCEVEIYATAMAAQELRWLTYLLTNLGERPRSPPIVYQRGQLRLTYVATRANTADIFTKALPPGDHQRFCTLFLHLVPTLPHLL